MELSTEWSVSKGEQNVTNTTQTDTAPFRGLEINVHASSFFVFIGSLEVMFGVAGNCLLLTVLFTFRSLGMRSFHHLLIANLALSDLTTLGYWMTFFVLDMILGYHPVVNNEHCKTNGFVIAVCLAAGVFSLVSISLNRYLHVCHNHLYTRVFTKARTVLCCVFIWLFSAILAAPPLFGVGEYVYSAEAHICSFRREENSLYPKTVIVVFVFLSLCTVGYLNHAIFRYWKMTRVKVRTKYPLVPSNAGKSDVMLEVWHSSSENKEEAETDMAVQPISEGGDTFGPDQSESSTSSDSENLDHSRFCDGAGSDFEFQQGEGCGDGGQDSGVESVCKRASAQCALELARLRASSNAHSAEDGMLADQNPDNTSEPHLLRIQGTQTSSEKNENSKRVSQNLHRNSKYHATDARQPCTEKARDKDETSKSPREAQTKGTEPERQAPQSNPAQGQSSQTQRLSSRVRRNLSQFLSSNKKALSPRSKRRQKQKASTLMRQIKRRRRKEHAKEVAFVRSLCVVVFLMLFCFLPFGVVMVVDAFHPLSPEMAMASNLILFFHCSVNWLVYGLMNKTFRRGYLAQVKKMACKCSRLPCPASSRKT